MDPITTTSFSRRSTQPNIKWRQNQRWNEKRRDRHKRLILWLVWAFLQSLMCLILTSLNPAISHYLSWSRLHAIFHSFSSFFFWFSVVFTWKTENKFGSMKEKKQRNTKKNKRYKANDERLKWTHMRWSI